MLSWVEIRLDAVEAQRMGTGPDTSDLDDQIQMAGAQNQAAVDPQEYEQAVSLRDRESELLASKAGRQEQWAAEHPSPPVAEQCQQLSGEIERLHACFASTASDQKTARHNPCHHRGRLVLLAPWASQACTVRGSRQHRIARSMRLGGRPQDDHQPHNWAELRAAAGPGSSTVCDERCHGRPANDVMLAVRRLTAADIPGRATSLVK